MKHVKILKSLGAFLIQLMAWASFIVFAPLMTWLTTRNAEGAVTLLFLLLGFITPSMVIYFINYYLLVPLFFLKSRGKRIWYFVINILILVLFGIAMAYKISNKSALIPEGAWLGITAGGTVIYVLNIGAIGLALAIRNYQRAQAIKIQLNEEKRRRTEAELVWLKNQLNPHFLFNSLNNISSLIYFDSEKAQDCIGKLSDLLRYAIYESEKKFVPLYKEMEFIRNYIELMSLRCNEKTEITSEFSYDNGNLEIVPLVLVSIIENAFKHGVSTAKRSFIKFYMSEKDGVLTFISENSNHAKSESDHSGSGIGLVNTKKRMDLIYGDNYSWSQFSDDFVFRVKIIIYGLKKEK